MWNLLAVVLGGAVGSGLRYLVSEWVHERFQPTFPYSTMGVNVLGCLLIGFLFVVFAGPYKDQEALRNGLMVGVLGGFTTFSTFSLQTVDLMFEGHFTKAGFNIGVSLAAGLFATIAGMKLAHMIFGTAAHPPIA